MKPKFRLTVALTAALVLGATTGFLSPLLGQTKKATTEIRAFSKVARGQEQMLRESLATCASDGHTTHGFLERVKADVSSLDCDEEPSKSHWNGVFMSDVAVVHREAPEANHRGC